MDDWIDLGPNDLSSGELRGLEVGERLVLLACHAGAVSAMEDSCNHAGCLLSGGWIDAKKAAVVCPCHEYQFELGTGRNLTFPRLCDDQRTFAVKQDRGRLFLKLSGGSDGT